MIVDQAGTYRLLEDITLRGETNTPATFKAGMLLTISHIDLVKKQVLGPAIPGWQFWELPVELVGDEAPAKRLKNKKFIITMNTGKVFVEENFNTDDVNQWDKCEDKDGFLTAVYFVSSVLDITNPYSILHLDGDGCWQPLENACANIAWPEADRGTVRRLHGTLSMLIDEGVGDKQIKAWDPDSDDYQPVTSATYQVGGDEPVKLYTDDID